MRPADAQPLVRHSLVWIARDAWPALVAAHRVLDGEPLARRWAECGWPLVVRRPAAGEMRAADEREGERDKRGERSEGCEGSGTGGVSSEPNEADETSKTNEARETRETREREPASVALGMPLPPSADKRRIGLVAPMAQVVRIEPPPSARDVLAAAPSAWRPWLASLDALAREHRVSCRVFGSLAWQALTGLPYLSETSDLDILLSVPDEPAALAPLLDALAALDARSPVRIDGEVIRADGAGANWRELRAGGAQIAVKTASGVQLCSAAEFVGQAP